MKRARSIKAVRNEARGTWVCFLVVAGKRTSRKLGNLNELDQKQADAKAAETVRNLTLQAKRSIVITVEQIVKQYREEALCTLRYATRRAAESWLCKYVIPRWGSSALTELQPRVVQLWLESLPLAPKTRGHIRGLLSRLVSYAMWAGIMPIAVNPLSLVTVKGSSKRQRTPHNLTVQQFHDMLSHLAEPFRTMATVQLCLGLRVSELLALRWQDVNFLEGKLTVERGIVNQHVGDTKTANSNRTITMSTELMQALCAWKQQSEFREAEDWMFASPTQIGRLPISYTTYRDALQAASQRVGIGKIGTHSLRHSYRSWLSAEGTDITVQRQLMRHSDLMTTLSYGQTDSVAMVEANARISEKAFQSDSRVIPQSVTH